MRSPAPTARELYAHCKRRAKERYGLDLSRAAWRELGRLARRREMVRVRLRRGSIIGDIVLQGQRVTVAYCPELDAVKTLLPQQKPSRRVPKGRSSEPFETIEDLRGDQ